ncbi:MAG: hypothetical protein HFE60_08605 [Anaerotignum sp.]|nr:hypothetical protein [Anaerotignum sp.]
MREEVLKSMYGVFLENISRETDEKFDAVGEYVFGITADEKDRDNVGLILADLMNSVFMESANMVLDFISGKGVEA